MKFRSLSALAALVVLVGALPSQAWALPPADVCDQDTLRLCGSGPFQRGEVFQCHVRHEAELSHRCAERVQGLREIGLALAQACAPEIAELCPGVAPVLHPVMRCLHPRFDHLSAHCQNAIENWAPIPHPQIPGIPPRR